MMWAFRAMGMWSDERGVNMLDTGAPYYDTYTCADGRQVAVGAIEPQFFAELLAKLGLDAGRPARPERHEPLARAARPAHRGLRRRTTATTGPRCSPTATPACTPVLSFAEVETEPHNTERAPSTARTTICSPRPRRGSPEACRPHRRHPGCPGPTPKPSSRLGIAERKQSVEIKDAVAVVTGGASGLGLATTKRLLDAGRKVVVLDIRGKRPSPNSATARCSPRPT